LADGQQPVANEDRSVSVVFNGELFDYLEKRAELEARGHRLGTHCDTEIIPHLWEEGQEGMFERLRGQFAVALWDERRHRLVLGRDRFGICPLYWTRQGDWFLFASEIKALLASGMVPVRPDLRGIDHIFTFSASPGPITCFEDVHLLSPGRYLQIIPGNDHGLASSISERAFWEMDFPDRGEENGGGDPRALVDRFEKIMLQAVEKRLRADVPVGAYLSGGVDSSMITALACHLKGPAINTYTIRVDAPELDELNAANLVARHIHTKPPIVQEFDASDALNTYPQLIQAAEAPVIDTSCAALLQLARRVHACGQKVVLTGEGADEWMAGYPWYKGAKALGFLDLLPGLPLSDRVRRAYLRLRQVPQYPPDFRRGVEESVGGPNAWIDAYGLLGLSKLRFYAPPMREVLEKRNPWTDLQIPLERAKRWHPLNRGIWVAARVTLAGHLLQAKGDRVSMHSSVEVRYVFLDEEVFSFLERWSIGEDSYIHAG
jgi:asparagine synthase (glutamine-hydrolysing)